MKLLNQTKKLAALILLITFPLTQISWGAEPVAMQDGHLQPVVDPLAQNVGAPAPPPIPNDFFEENPLSPPTPQANQLPARIEVRVGDDLQSVFEDAQEGQIIYLHNGTYHGHFILKEGVNLVGESRGGVILHGNFESKKDVLTAQGNNTIENLTITGGGIYSWDPSSALNIKGDHVKVLNNDVVGNKDYGIYISADVSDVLIEGNFLKENNLAIQLPKDRNLIRFNTFVKNNISINILGAKAPTIEFNIITDSTFQSIYEYGWQQNHSTSRAIVRGNTLFNNVERGGATYLNLPAAISSRDGSGWSQENVLANPQFTNPTAGDYSVANSSPAFRRGSQFAGIWNWTVANGATLTYKNSTLVSRQESTGLRTEYGVDGISKVVINSHLQWQYASDAAHSISIVRDGVVIKTITNAVPTAPDLTSAVKVTLEGGLEAYYLNGQLIEIRTFTGIRIFNIVMSVPTNAAEAPGILEAVMRYADGTTDIVSDKKLIRRVNSDGSIVDYLPDGTIAREFSGSTQQTYLATYNQAGAVSGTSIINSLGDETVYDIHGILSAVYAHDGKRFIYDAARDGLNWALNFNSALSSPASPDTLISGKYAHDGTIMELQLQDGRRILFKNGRMKQLVNAAGEIVDYTDILSNNSAQGLKVSRTDANFQYNSNGFLSQIETANGTITRRLQDSNHDGQINNQDTVDLLLELAGGHKLTDFQLDANGNILNGIIETREGIKQKIENGVLKELLTADGKKYSITNGQAKLESWTFQNGLVVKYGDVGINEILFPDRRRFDQIHLNAQKEIQSYVEVAVDGMQDFYENSKLVKRVLPGANGAQIFYDANGRATKMFRAGSTIEERVQHQFDANGQWLGLRLVSPDGELVYDADGDLTALLTSGLSAQVENDLIKSISTRFGNVPDPSFNVAGNMSGKVILSDERKLLVQDGKLIRMTLKNGTKIDYTDGRITQVENAEGVYQLTYIDGSDKLEDVKVNWILKNSTPATELVTETIPIVPKGNPKLSSETGKFGSYLSLDGAGDYLTLSDSPDFNLGTKDFTVDFQALWNDETSYSRLFEIGSYYGTGKGISVQWYPNVMEICYNGGNCNDIPFQHEAGKWYHLAFVREGSTFKFYADGKKVGSFAMPVTTNIQTGGAGAVMGVWANYPNSYNLKGGIDEFRISDAARWTTNFTTPTEEYGIDLNTILLHHMNQVNIAEKVPAGVTISKFGDAKVYSPQAVFGNAIHFDGVGDELKIYDNTLLNFGGKDFTIDFRANFEQAKDGERYTFMGRGDSAEFRLIRETNNRIRFELMGSTYDFDTFRPQANRWYHFALVRQNGQLKLYIDGVTNAAQFSAPQNISLPTANPVTTIGAWYVNNNNPFIGMMDEFRISDSARWSANFTVPTQPYVADAHTNFLHHMDDFNPAVAAHEIIKSGNVTINLVTETIPIISVGDLKTSSDNEKFGNYLSLDGIDDYLSSSNFSDLNFGTRDLTVDFWVNSGSSSGDPNLVGFGSIQNGLNITSHGELIVYFSSTQYFNTGYSLLKNQWQHVAVVRSGNILKVFVDGRQVGLNYDVTGRSITNPPSGIMVGYRPGHNRWFNGSIDEVRISDKARWTENFTPSTTEYTVDDKTIFLDHFNDTKTFQTKHDSEPLNIQTISVAQQGNVSVSAGTAVFDGGGDALAIPDNESFNLASNNFTIDTKIKFDTLALYQTVFIQDEDNGYNAMFLYQQGGQWVLGIKDSNVYRLQMIIPDDIVAGQWYHIAIVRNGSQFTFYRDGISKATGIYSGAIKNYAGPFELGWNHDPIAAQYYNGMSLKGALDEFRISNGIARWTSNFTLPTADYVPDTYTAFLHHFNPLSNAQSVAIPILLNAVGDARIFSSEGSLGDAIHFDGVNDALKVYGGEALNLGTEDFTIDFRTKFESLADYQWAMLLSRDSGADIRIARNSNNQLEVYLEGTQFLFGEFKPEANHFYHLAFIRKNGQLNFYIDGKIRPQTYTSNQNMLGTASMNIGLSHTSYFFKGLMDEFRISDIARWDANFAVPTQAYKVDGHTRFLHHMDDFGRAESGIEVLNYGTIDAGENYLGSVVANDVEKVFGDSSLKLSGAGINTLQVPEINFGNGDFTVEGWFKSAAAVTTAGIWQKFADVNNYVRVMVNDSRMYFQVVKNGNWVVNVQITQFVDLTQWSHIAAVKDGMKYVLYVNGRQLASGVATDAIQPDLIGKPLEFGRLIDWPQYNFNGWMDELRVSDKARYLSNFSPANQSFALDADTLFLHHGEGQGVRAADNFKQPSGEMGLARYLLENPNSEFAKIISPRPVNDVFKDGASYLLKDSSLTREMTMTGDVKLSTDGEKFDFDGIGDTVTMDGSNVDFGTGNFTIEARVQFNSMIDRQTILSDYSSGGWIWEVLPTTGQVRLWYNGNAYTYFTVGGWEINKPYELAISRVGNNIRFYRDGAQLGGDRSPATSYTGDPNWPLQIGSYAASWHFNGSIDRLRITKGVGKYFNATYSVPTNYIREANTEILLNFTASEFNQKREIVTRSGVVPATFPDRLDLADWVNDLNRGDVLDVSGYTNPRVDGIYQTGTIYTYGYLQSQYSYEVVTGLYDMDGDGDLDRVSLDSSEQFWWVQKLKNGSYLAPEKWTGIRNNDISNLAAYPYALRNYYAGYPIVMDDLVDVNGDGRPDRVLSNVGTTLSQWQIQINNGHGFDPAEIWTGIQSLSYAAIPQASYAVRVRDSANEPSAQPVIADLIDLDGDGIPDRITQAQASPIPGADLYDHWIFQKGNGHGFEPATIWSGIDHTFSASAKIAGSMGWFIRDGSISTEIGRLEDLNGDKLPDRILMKPKAGADGYDWYWQKNNGHGFDAAILWDDSIRPLLGVSANVATSIQAFDSSANDRSYSVFFKDVTGDGLPDRVTVNMLAGTTAQNIWWVEENDGTTFKDAVIWSGIEGSNMSQSSPGQEMNSADSLKQISGLFDVNGDKIPDRVYFKDGSNAWQVQYGTGHSFLPSKAMTVSSVRAEAITEKYDYVHVSLRADDAILANKGKVIVRLLDQSGALVQSWDIVKPGTDWKDNYLKLDPTKTNGRYIELEWKYDFGTYAIAPQILVEDVGLTAFRPNASTEWLDYLLTEGNVVNAVRDAVNDPLIRDLGRVINPQAAFDWKKLLAVETRIDFNEGGQVSGTQNLNGDHSTVQTLGEVTTVTTTHADGSTTQTQVPSVGASANLRTQTITHDNGTPTNLTDDYTETATIAYDRIRSVTRDHDGKRPLRYSYVFDDLGRELTVIYDPDSHETQKSRVINTSTGSESRIVAQIAANGVETRYTYNDRAELTRTEIVYKGRVRETFEQSITADGLHALKTESGTTEFYNDQGQIVGHLTSDGYYYKHEFGAAKKVVMTTATQIIVLCDPATQDCSAIRVEDRTLTVQVPTVTLVDCSTTCEQVHQVTLDHFTDKNGNVASYAGSQLSGLNLATGLKMTMDGVTSEDTKDANGNDITITKPKNVIIFHQDGTITEFRDGKPYSVTSATGRVISIEPDVATGTDPHAGSGSGSGSVPSGVPILKNPSAAAEFHYAEALKLWNQTVLINFTQFSLGKGLTVQTEYTADGSKLVTRLYSEGVRELYNTAGKIEMMVSEDGERTVLYDYDTENNPTMVHLEYSRRRFERAVLELKVEVALEHYNAIVRVAEREQVLDETIEGEYIIQRNQLLALRSQIESQRNQVASIKVKGKAGKNAISDAMQQISAGLGQVNQALYQLLENRNQSLATLSTQVSDLSSQIESQTSQAYADILAKEKEIQKSILTQEISPIVYHWYRKILGRDPSKAEYESAKVRANYIAGTFDLAGLKLLLQNSAEFSQRTAEVNAIKAAVRVQLTSYLAINQIAKTAFVNTLGIDPVNTVSLAQGEVDAILSWIDKQNLHFGQSAFIALEALLDDANIAHNRINLARDLILTDILTGTLTPLEKGDLLISMYAMNSYAARFGLNLSPLKITYDALKSIFDNWCAEHGSCAGFRLVAHMDGNHYVIVTGISTRIEDGKSIEEVHYTDPGAGKNGDEATVVSKDDFLKYWINKSAKLNSPDSANSQNPALGYILSPRAPPVLVGPLAANAGSYLVLDPHEQMQVRGSFFFLIPIIVAAIVVAIQAVVGVIIAAITAIIGALVASVSSIIGGFSAFFGGLLTGNFAAAFGGLFTGIFNGLTALGGLVFNAITFGPNAVLGILGLEAGSFLGGTIFAAVLGGQFTAVGKGLEFLGVSPKLTQTIISAGKIIAGVGALAAGGVGAVALGLGFIGAGTTSILSLHTNLSPAVINTISIGAQILGVFLGSGGVGDFNWQEGLNALKDNLPYFAKELASAGVVGLGSSLDWDPRLTGLLDIGVRAVVGGLTRHFTEGDMVVGWRSDGTPIMVTPAGGVLDYVKNAVSGSGTLGNAFSVGAQYLLEKTNFPGGLAGVLQISANSVLKAVFDNDPTTTVGSALLGNKETIFSELLKYGIQQAGDALGIDPTIIGLAVNTGASLVDSILNDKPLDIETFWKPLADFVEKSADKLIVGSTLPLELKTFLLGVAADLKTATTDDNPGTTILSVLQSQKSDFIKLISTVGIQKLVDLLRLDPSLASLASDVLGRLLNAATDHQPLTPALWDGFEKIVLEGVSRLSTLAQIPPHLSQIFGIVTGQIIDALKDGDPETTAATVLENKFPDIIRQFALGAFSGLVKSLDFDPDLARLAEKSMSGLLDAVLGAKAFDDAAVKAFSDFIKYATTKLNETVDGAIQKLSARLGFSSELTLLLSSLAEQIANGANPVVVLNARKAELVGLMTQQGINAVARSLGLNDYLAAAVQVIAENFINGTPITDVLWDSLKKFAVASLDVVTRDLGLPTALAGAVEKTAGDLLDALSMNDSAKLKKSIDDNLLKVVREAAIYGTTVLGTVLGVDYQRAALAIQDAVLAIIDHKPLEQVFWNHLGKFVKEVSKKAVDDLNIPAGLKMILNKIAAELSIKDPLSAFNANVSELVDWLTQYGVERFTGMLGLNAGLTANMREALSAYIKGESLDAIVYNNIRDFILYGVYQLKDILSKNEWVSFGIEDINADDFSPQKLAELIGVSNGDEGLWDKVMDALIAGLLVPPFAGKEDAERASSKIESFSLNLLDADFVVKLNTNSYSIFDRSAIEQIHAKGLAAILSLPRMHVTLLGGKQAEEIKFSDLFSLYFDLSGNLIARKIDGRLEIGSFGFLGSALGVVNGDLYISISSDFSLRAEIKAGKLNEASIKKGDELVLEIQGKDGYLGIDLRHFIGQGVLVLKGNVKLTFDAGVLKDIARKTAFLITKTLVPETKTERGTRSYFLNGIDNPGCQRPGYESDVLPCYALDFQEALTIVDSTNKYGFLDMVMIPQFVHTTFISGALEWLQQIKLGATSNEAAIIKQLTEDYNNGLIHAGDVVNIVGYSGGGQVALEAIKKLPFNVRANMIMIGAPLIEPTLGSRVDSFLRFVGSADFLAQALDVLFINTLSYRAELYLRGRSFHREILEGYEHFGSKGYFSYAAYPLSTNQLSYVGFLINRMFSFFPTP